MGYFYYKKASPSACEITGSPRTQHWSNCRIDAHSDSLRLVKAWQNQGGKSAELNVVIKSIFKLSLRASIGLTLYHVPSKENWADCPSRALSANDCMLTGQARQNLERRWGPHTIDLMSLDSNVHNGTDGLHLRHFTQPIWPTPNSIGVNLFAQSVNSSENPYVFPPTPMIGPVLRFLFSMGCNFTVVIPDLFPRQFRWPLIEACIRSL